MKLKGIYESKIEEEKKFYLRLVEREDKIELICVDRDGNKIINGNLLYIKNGYLYNQSMWKMDMIFQWHSIIVEIQNRDRVINALYS